MNSNDPCVPHTKQNMHYYPAQREGWLFSKEW